MNSNVSPECLDAFPEPLLVVGDDGRLHAANAPAATLLGLSPGGRPEITLREIAGLSAVEFDNLLQSCLATALPIQLRLTFYPAAGRPLALRCEGWRCLLGGENAALIRISDDAQTPSRFRHLVDELDQECRVRRHHESSLRSALTRLNDIDSIRDRNLAQMGHDLRTPLNAIIGMTEFMRAEPFGPLGEKYSEYVDDIHTSGGLLLRLVDQVLRLAWVDNQSRSATTEALADLGECLDNCCKVVEPIAKLRGLHILLPEHDSIPRLRADQLLVKQILLNLLGNAAKYTGSGGHIEVSIEWRRGHALAIRVRDDGPGIPKEQLAAINGDHMAPSTYVTIDRQSGFGLALSRRTAKAIGGRLNVRSIVGEGTVASLVLPPHLVEGGQAAVHEFDCAAG
jgi:signal transduction histidine kinase